MSNAICVLTISRFVGNDALGHSKTEVAKTLYFEDITIAAEMAVTLLVSSDRPNLEDGDSQPLTRESAIEYINRGWDSTIYAIDVKDRPAMLASFKMATVR